MSTREHGDHPYAVTAVRTQTHTHTHTADMHKSPDEIRFESNKNIPPSQGSANAPHKKRIDICGCYKPDGRVKCTVGLHKSQTQEPVIVFPCLSYPNGDRLRQAMPEGYQSLSTLPGKGLLVRMGLESSLRFLPARPPARPATRSALC